MVSIDAELAAIKRDPLEMLDGRRIVELCRESGYWPEADGKLDPPTLIALFMRQVAAGNVSCDQVRLMGQDAFSASGSGGGRDHRAVANPRDVDRGRDAPANGAGGSGCRR